MLRLCFFNFPPKQLIQNSQRVDILFGIDFAEQNESLTSAFANKSKCYLYRYQDQLETTIFYKMCDLRVF